MARGLGHRAGWRRRPRGDRLGRVGCARVGGRGAGRAGRGPGRLWPEGPGFAREAPHRVARPFDGRLDGQEGGGQLAGGSTGGSPTDAGSTAAGRAVATPGPAKPVGVRTAGSATDTTRIDTPVDTTAASNTSRAGSRPRRRAAPDTTIRSGSPVGLGSPSGSCSRLRAWACSWAWWGFATRAGLTPCGAGRAWR